MTNRHYEEQAEEHYDECEFRISSSWPCTCEQIEREDAAWRAEPADMFEREWGSFCRPERPAGPRTG